MASELSFRDRVDQIKAMLCNAGATSLKDEMKGYAYGGFVRDVLVWFSDKTGQFSFQKPTTIRDALAPLSDKVVKFSFQQPTIRDVDIWFRNELAANRFIVEMGNRLVKSKDCDVFPTRSEYPFKRLNYGLMNGDQVVAWVDIIISSEFPVNDFCANCLTYNPTWSTFISHCQYTVNEIATQISHKIAVRHPDFNKRLPDESPHRADCYRRRIAKFIERGWRFTDTWQSHMGAAQWSCGEYLTLGQMFCSARPTFVVPQTDLIGRAHV